MKSNASESLMLRKSILMFALIFVDTYDTNNFSNILRKYYIFHHDFYLKTLFIGHNMSFKSHDQF